MIQDPAFKASTHWCSFFRLSKMTAILNNTNSVNFIPDTVLLGFATFRPILCYCYVQKFHARFVHFFAQLNLSNFNASYIRDTTGYLF